MKKYLIFDLDGTLVQSNNQVDTIIYKHISENLDPELIDYARYLIENNQGMSLYELLEKLLDGDSEKSKIHADTIYKKIESIGDEVNYFSGVQSFIKELSKNYTLLLSTGNSDLFANQILDRGGIKNCFEKILGSSLIPKSPQHIQEFIEYTGDEDFAKKSVFIGDGQRDKLIAETYDIDFIRVGNFGEDKYEVPSVLEISEIIKELEK